jgi:hypothetical protein
MMKLISPSVIGSVYGVGMISFVLFQNSGVSPCLFLMFFPAAPLWRGGGELCLNKCVLLFVQKTLFSLVFGNKAPPWLLQLLFGIDGDTLRGLRCRLS